MDLLPDFKDLLSALADSSADYLVVGGWAVGFHSEPRFTKDLDLLIGTDATNLSRVVDALDRFGAPRTIVAQLANLGPDEFLFLGTPPARVDLLRTIPGVDFRSAMARAVRVDWDGVPASILSREDLIASKRAAGRERDLRDLRTLERQGKGSE
jgi:predicted nucleotidyltransferase